MIPINRPWLGEDEKREVIRVLEDSTLTSAARDGGRRVQEFEAALKGYLGSKHVIAVNSGTAALYAALLAVGIGKNDDVLVPSFTFVATANAVVAVGARPIFVDVKKDDFTIDQADMKAKITRRTKAVIPVHLYGHPCDIDVIEVAEKRSIAVIEDACQSLGSTYHNKPTGTFGTMGCFSFYASKVLTSGEGGAIATDEDKLADRLRSIRNHGMVSGYDTTMFGLNLRLPEVSAAIAKVQMNKLQFILTARKRNADLLSSMLSGVKGISLPVETTDKRFNWYLYTVAFSSTRARGAATSALRKAGIDSAVYYDPPVHRMPFYRKLEPRTRLSVTEWSAKHVLSIPVHQGVSPSDIERMAGVLTSI